jgi:hypothetical protein
MVDFTSTMIGKRAKKKGRRIAPAALPAQTAEPLHQAITDSRR